MKQFEKIHKEESVVIASDESIIDVTGQHHSLDNVYEETDSNLVISEKKVPFWKKEYIYSTSHLHYADVEIKHFYQEYKEAFLEGIYYDLEGNCNYAFTLMFELFYEYEKHKNLTRLTHQMLTLVKKYPHTKYYVERDLILKAKKDGRRKIQSSQDEVSIENLIDLFPDSGAWTFSDKYAKKLGLTQEENELFNYLDSRYSFYARFEFMKIKHAELFRNVIRTVEKKYQQEGQSLENIIESLYSRYKPTYNHNEYTYVHNEHIQERKKRVYLCILRHCRNKLYQRYDEFQWIVDIFSQEHSRDSKRAINELLKNIEPTITAEVEVLPELTVEEEIIINKTFTTRWRARYQKIITSFDGNIPEYIQCVEKLVEQNKANRGLKHLFFESSKFLVEKDNIMALKMYLRYVAVHKDSVRQEKPLPKNACKRLFKKQEQQEEFDNVIRQYKIDLDLLKAYEAIDLLFIPKRKKINLCANEINKISELHSETVSLLNEVFEEGEETKTVFTLKDINKSEQPIALLDSVHLELLDLFAQNNYSLTKTQVKNFVRANGLMINRLIEQVNDLCYEILDDVMIENENDCWIIQEGYLKKITAFAEQENLEIC